MSQTKSKTNKNETAAERNLQPLIKNVDMTSEMTEALVKICAHSFKTCTTETEMAKDIRERCCEDFGGMWMCAVGKDFGADVTHENKKFMWL